MLYCESESVLLVLSIPWVHVYTMTQCLNHGSLSIPWSNVYTMSPCVYHESLFIQFIHVYSIARRRKNNNTNLRDTVIQITGIQKCKLHINRNTSCKNTEIQMTKKNRITNYRNKEMQKYKLQANRNTSE